MAKKKKQVKKESENYKELLSLEKDKNLRLFAEFENFRKRTAKEKLDLYSSANKEVIQSLLPILDNFERSISANNYKKDDGPFLIYNQLKGILEKQGLSEIDNPIGKEFDINYHEAITQVKTEKKKDIGKIIDTVEKGYIMNDKVIRYAKVVVCK